MTNHDDDNVHTPGNGKASVVEPVAPVPAAPEPSYAVGYAKPPAEHRFKPGKSGNPKGRPKGARGMNTMVRDILSEKVLMTIGGKQKKVLRIEALLMKALELGSKGDLRAIDRMIRLYQVAVPDTLAVPVVPDVPEESDDAILQSLYAIVAERILAEGDGK